MADRNLTMALSRSLAEALGVLPDGWFIYHLGEHVKPQSRRGDKHDHICWAVELQHRDGGRLTKAEGASPDEALLAAIENVEKRHAGY